MQALSGLLGGGNLTNDDLKVEIDALKQMLEAADVFFYEMIEENSRLIAENIKLKKELEKRKEFHEFIKNAMAEPHIMKRDFGGQH